MATTGTTSVLAHAILLLKECYGEMGAEPNLDTDAMGELINPASEKLFEALDAFLKEVTELPDEVYKQWLLTTSINLSALTQTLETRDLDRVAKNLENKEHYY